MAYFQGRSPVSFREGKCFFEMGAMCRWLLFFFSGKRNVDGCDMANLGCINSVQIVGYSIHVMYLLLTTDARSL